MSEENQNNQNPVVLNYKYPMVGIKRFQKLRRILKSLKGGSTMDAACKSAGIAISTFWEWRQTNPRLASLAYRIIDSRVLVMEDSLYNQGVKGNVKAIMEFLYNRDPLRWKNSAALNQVINILQNAQKTDKFLEAPRFVFKDAIDE